MSDDADLSVGQEIEILTQQATGLLDWSGRKYGNENANVLWDLLRDIARLTRISVALDGDSWNNFFRVLRLVPDHQMKSGEFYAILARDVETKIPDDILDKLTGAIVADARTASSVPDTVLSDILNKTRQGGLNGGYYDDMPESVSTAVGAAHAQILDWCAQTDGTPRAMEWIKQLYNETYTDGKERRGSNSPYNGALLERFNAYADQTIAGLSPRLILTGIFHMYAGLEDGNGKHRLAACLYEKENAALPRLEKFLDIRIKEDPQAAYEIIHHIAGLDARIFPEGRGKRTSISCR